MKNMKILVYILLTYEWADTQSPQLEFLLIISLQSLNS